MKRRRRMELILAGAMLTLSACQATPTEDVIVQKAEQQEMLTQAAETSPDMEGKNLKERYQIPDSISFDVSSEDGMRVYKAENAPVIVPDIEEAAVASANRCDYIDEDTKLWTEVFFGDREVWKTEEEVLTKSDYLEIIANREASFEATKKDIEAGFGDGLTMEECLKDHEESMEFLTKRMEAAPEEAPEPGHQTPDYVLTPGRQSDSFDITGDMDGETAVLVIDQGEWYTNAYYRLDTEEITLGADHWYNDGLELPNVCIYSEEEAVRMAKEMLEKLQPGNNLELRKCIPRYDPSDEDYDNMLWQPESYCGYTLFFSREVNGLMENDTFSGKVTEDPENDVNVPFGYEEVEVDIDNKGIVFLWWENRMQAGEIQQENVQLLPFEKIQAIIEEQITMQDAAREIDWKIEDNVTSVELGTLCILTPNEKDVYTMVPVWEVYGTESNGNQVGSEIVLTINAINGSIINRKNRY